MKFLALTLLMFSLIGCLKTRSELSDYSSGDKSSRTNTSSRNVEGNMGQQQRAQIDSRFFEIDRDFRQLYGKIETIERQLSDSKDATQSNSSSQADLEKIKQLEKRISTLEEAILSIDKKMSSQKNQNDKTSATTAKPKGPFGYGEYYFSQKKYENAITSYDDYRKKYPKGKHYAQATLKMGLCFQKLKLGRDAKAFYKEVIQRFPNTEVSKKAQKNLKSI